MGVCVGGGGGAAEKYCFCFSVSFLSQPEPCPAMQQGMQQLSWVLPLLSSLSMTSYIPSRHSFFFFKNNNKIDDFLK